MRALPQFALPLATILLCAGLAAGADLESAQHAYQQEDYATALKDATTLAEQGDAEAQVLLGRMYLTGRGVPKDPDTALKWFKEQRGLAAGIIAAGFGGGVLLAALSAAAQCLDLRAGDPAIWRKVVAVRRFRHGRA